MSYCFDERDDHGADKEGVPNKGSRSFGRGRSPSPPHVLFYRDRGVGKVKSPATRRLHGHIAGYAGKIPVWNHVCKTCGKNIEKWNCSDCKDPYRVSISVIHPPQYIHDGTLVPARVVPRDDLHSICISCAENEMLPSSSRNIVYPPLLEQLAWKNPHTSIRNAYPGHYYMYEPYENPYSDIQCLYRNPLEPLQSCTTSETSPTIIPVAAEIPSREKIFPIAAGKTKVYPLASEIPSKKAGVPGYKGFTPGMHDAIGETFGRARGRLYRGPYY